MKKRNLNSKKMRLLSVGLLASTAVLSVEDTQPILAQDSKDQATKEAEGKETVNILSSSKEATITTTEELSNSTYDTSNSETIETSTTQESSSDIEESDTTDTTVESTTDTSSENSSSTTDSTTSTSTSTSSSNSTSSTSSSSSSSSTSSSTSTSSSSKPKPSKPKPTKPSSQRPERPSQPTIPARPNGSTTPNYGTGANASTPVGEQVFHISPNLTTKAFVGVIGEDARNIAGQNNLYASVMIAQAILESASGNSALASAPNYNLFGIKGSYKGQSANFLTSEDNGSGGMYTIRSNFRKYPSYKESLGDYVKLIRGGTDSSNGFYSGVWKSNTKTYKDATKYLTGRYATDTSYAAKLNSLIEAYNLTKYDEIKDKKSTDSKIFTSVDKVEKRNTEKDQKLDFITHTVKKGESLKSISDLYNISTLAILEKNQLDRRMLYVGQKLIIPKQKNLETTLVKKEDVVDRSLEVVKKVSSAFTGKEVQVAKKSTSEYQVSASRKKTDATYKVKKNDTLASISKETGISVWSLKEWNQLDKYFLTEGQLLLLAPSYNV